MFSASAQKAVNRESCTQEAAALQQQYEEILHKAKEMQTALEDLLARWQR
jgi:nesprin-1